MSDALDPNLIPPTMAAEFRDPTWGAGQLQAVPVFKGFTNEELKKVYARGEIISLKTKSYAVIEGEPTRGLFIILHGTMSVYKNDSTTGAMHRIAYLEAGKNFGELSLFDTAPRSATVSAESICHLFHLEASVFHAALEQLGNDAKSRFYKSCAEDLVVRFRKLNTDYVSVQQTLWRYALRRKDEPTEQAQKSEKAA